jgi:hypothetical protein
MEEGEERFLWTFFAKLLNYQSRISFLGKSDNLYCNCPTGPEATLMFLQEANSEERIGGHSAFVRIPTSPVRNWVHGKFDRQFATERPGNQILGSMFSVIFRRIFTRK